MTSRTTAAAEAVADKQRLAHVHGTGLLSTPVEAAFDRMTRLAARLTGSPVSFLSVVDEDHDFFKSCLGVPEPLASVRRVTGRTFCHFALLADEPLRVRDARLDPDLSHIPTVRTLGVVAYLGVPLKLSSGACIGAMCVVDFTPRDWTDEEVEVMTELAESALREVELRQAINERSRTVAAITAHLRDPLTVLQLNVDLLEECGPGAEHRTHVSRIREACERIEQGVKECLLANQPDPSPAP